MIRLFPFIVFVGVFFLPAGCNGDKDKPIWQDVKIADLAPIYGPAGPKHKLETIDFDIYVFEMPAESAALLDDIWPVLYTQPLRFNSQSAFSANLFSAGFGRGPMWDKAAEVLRSGGAKKIRKVSLYLLDAQPNDVMVARVYGRQNISYIRAEGSSDRVSVGPGMLVLRLKAEKIPGSRGLCRVTILPVFSPRSAGAARRLAAQTKFGEVAFDAVGFELKMSQGDFVFLGPKKYLSAQVNLAGCFFSTSKEGPTVRTYLIVCAGIID